MFLLREFLFSAPLVVYAAFSISKLSGIQVWGPPVRTAGTSEILIIDVALRDAH